MLLRGIFDRHNLSVLEVVRLWQIQKDGAAQCFSQKVVGRDVAVAWRLLSEIVALVFDASHWSLTLLHWFLSAIAALVFDAMHQSVFKYSRGLLHACEGLRSAMAFRPLALQG